MKPQDLGLDPKRFPAYRDDVEQEKVILQLASSDKRVTVLNASPGAGKSVINVSAALVLDVRALYLTVTKSLQDQLKEFSSPPVSMFDIRGHGNYSCARTTYSDDGEMADLECHARRGNNGNNEDSDTATGCLYQNDVYTAIERNLISTNYAHWVSIFKAGDAERIGPFDLLICDEAHAIHDKLTDYVSISFSRSTIESYLRADWPKHIPIHDFEGWKQWADYAREKARRQYRIVKSSNGTKKELAIITKLGQSLTRLIDELDSTWVAQKTHVGVKFSPILAKPYAEDYLFRSIPRIILTSATVTKQDALDLGIDPKDLEVIELDSSFPVKNRPIIYCPTTPPVKIDNKMNEGGWRLVVNRIVAIIQGRLDRKGLIHARSYERAKEIVRRLQEVQEAGTLDDSLEIFLHDKSNARAVIDKFKKSLAPSLLVSPSIEEGEDFKQDLARYQIIIKVPFLDSRDPMIAARKLHDKRYTDREVARSIIQMAGRPVRSKQDYAECVSPETRILTDDLHWVPAGDIQRGQRLLAIDEHSPCMGEKLPGMKAFRRWRWSFVEKSVISRMPRMRVILEDRELVCTPNHMWLVYGPANTHLARMLVWRRTDELTIKDKLIIAMPTWGTNRSWAAGYASGFTDGEGCLVVGQGKRNPLVSAIYISQTEGLVFDFVASLLKDLGFSFKEYCQKKSTRITGPTMNRDMMQLRLNGGHHEVLRFLGTVRPLRLLNKFMETDRGGMFKRYDLSQLVRTESMTPGDICSFQTSTKTFLAEGCVAHNTFFIDAHWGHFKNKSGLFPYWFRKAFVVADGVPVAPKLKGQNT